MQPNEFISIMVSVQNLTGDIAFSGSYYERIMLTESMFADTALVLSLTITADPSDHFICHGTMRDVPIGRLESNATKAHALQAVFVAGGQFAVSAEVYGFADSQKDMAPCGRASMTVLSRSTVDK